MITDTGRPHSEAAYKLGPLLCRGDSKWSQRVDLSEEGLFCLSIMCLSQGYWIRILSKKPMRCIPKFLMTFIVCIWIRVGWREAHGPPCICGDQKIIWENLFSPSKMWVPGTQLRSWDLALSVFPTTHLYFRKGK